MAATMNLHYTGPLAECGFTGPATGGVYIVRAGEVFAAAAEDAPGLLRRHGDVLQETKPARPARKTEPEVEEVSAEEGDDGTDGSQDAAQPE